MQSLTAGVVRSAVAGNAEAIRAIVLALQGPFYNLALRMLLIPADAEEATQEALLRVVTRLSSYRGDAKFSTWAWKVAVRRILDFRDGARRAPMMTFDGFAADLADGIDRHARMPDDTIELQQMKLGCGRALLQCLDGEHRVVYVLGEILELTGPEGAEVLGVSPQVWRKRLSRARTRIRDALGNQCGIVNPDAACHCHRRLDRAKTLGRLFPEDAGNEIDVAEVATQVQSIDELVRHGAYYRADPQTPPGPELLARVRHALQLPAE